MTAPPLSARVPPALVVRLVAVKAPPRVVDPAAQRAEVHADVVKMIETYKKTDPGIDRFFKNSAGYAVFPRIGKAGFIVGGGAGDGEVFEDVLLQDH